MVPVVSSTGGTLADGLGYFYALTTLDQDGGESGLSFIAQAVTGSGTNTNSVVLDGISLPAGATGFNVYRGVSAGSLLRIASSQSAQASFTDTGLPAQIVLPPDPQFDHVDIYWRWELLPETGAAIHSTTTIGNSLLEMVANEYSLAVVRITRGTGAGQDRVIAGNDQTTIAVQTPWTIAPDATSFFTVSEASWRVGGRGSGSPIAIEVAERIGTTVQISARAANVGGDEADYALSPLTRWTIGSSLTLTADADVPPAPNFGLVVSPTRGGVLNLGAVSFTSLTNTRSIVAGTYRFHFYDEVNGLPPAALGAPIAIDDTQVRFTSTVAPGSFLQIEAEILLADVTDAAGNTAVTRAVHGATAIAHDATAVAYLLTEKVAIVPFVKNFFGSPASGDWKYSLELPNVRLASAELYMTNALGDGAVAAQPFTGTNDLGIRTLSGGQLSFQIAGYLAIQTSAAPAVIVDADRSVRDIYAVLSIPPSGAAVTLQLNLNGAPYATVQFDPNTISSAVVPGFGLPALHGGDLLTLDITAVGTTYPGSDLTLVIRL